MVEPVTNANNSMNDRFETLGLLGILPGLVTVAGKLSPPQSNVNMRMVRTLWLL